MGWYDIMGTDHRTIKEATAAYWKMKKEQEENEIRRNY